MPIPGRRGLFAAAYASLSLRNARGDNSLAPPTRLQTPSPRPRLDVGLTPRRHRAATLELATHGSHRMLTPKHRALFTAAYATPLLRVAGDEPEPPPAGSEPAEAPAARETDTGPASGGKTY
jgi:hypothetical protein